LDLVENKTFRHGSTVRNLFERNFDSVVLQAEFNVIALNGQSKWLCAKQSSQKEWFDCDSVR